MSAAHFITSFKWIKMCLMFTEMQQCYLPNFIGIDYSKVHIFSYKYPVLNSITQNINVINYIIIYYLCCKF